MRLALEEANTQLERSGAFSNINSSRERYRLYRHALKLLEADLRRSRKQKRARMALSHDWNGMSSYLRESLAIWKYRVTLRFAAAFTLLGVPPSMGISETTACEVSGSSILDSSTARPQLVGHSGHGWVGFGGLSGGNVPEYRSRLQRRGVTIARDKPSTPIRTGSFSLDQALRIGGFPRGRIVEIFGKEGVGKTTLALAAAANVQNEGEKLAYFDNEYKLDFSWARTLGVRADQALILQGTRAKETLDSLLDIVRSGDFALVVLDTLAALFPNEFLEDVNSQFQSEMEQLFIRALPRIAAAANRAGTCILLLNQIRRNDEQVFGRPTVSVGGHVLDHCSSIRLELQKGLADKRGDEEVLGRRVKGTVVKNCLGAPFGTAEWAINFKRGLDQPLELIEQGLNRGVIEKQTSALRFRGRDLGCDKRAARGFLLEHPDVATALEAQLRARANCMAEVG